MNGHKYFTCFTLLAFHLNSGSGQSINQNRFYSIIAPATFTPNAPYEVLVANYGSSRRIVIATITSEQGKRLAKADHVEVGEAKLLVLPATNWGPDIYTLDITVKGVNTDDTHSKRLKYREKRFSTFIQTDKAIYKPGQLVQFRVITTDDKLKPYNAKESIIFITDSHNNRVKQWKDVNFYKGVFEGKLQLSDQVLLGEWTINTKLENNQQLVKKIFTIEKYVLPTFEVSIRPTSYVTCNDSNLVITVEAKYTYGKPVKGTLFIAVRYSRNRHNSFTTTKPIRGKTDIELEVMKDLRIYHCEEGKYEIFAKVVEELTDRQQNGSAEFTMHKSKYKLTFLDVKKYKPGLNYSGTLLVTLQDGSPIQEGGVVTIRHCTPRYQGRRHYRPYTKCFEAAAVYTLDANVTIIPIQIDLTPPSRPHFLILEAEFKDAKARIADNTDTSSRYHIRIAQPTQKLKIGDDLTLNIDSSINLHFPLTLLAIGRNKILDHKTIAPSGSRFQRITLKITSDMAPKIHIIIYGITPEDGTVADSIDLSVDGLLETKIGIEIHPKLVKPGYPVTVNISSEPESYVGLLAVDQSVLLLKAGNDLTTKEISDEILSYDSHAETSYGIVALFSNAGMCFFSNELEMMPRAMRMRGGMAIHRVYDYDATNVGPSSNQQPSLMKPKRIRHHFPETFLWTNTTTGKDGRTVIEVIAPDTITSYVISAFAIDDYKGLGITTTPAKLQIFRPFFIVINLPYSVIRGETLALQALVFNYMKDDIEAEVTLENEHNALILLRMENGTNVDKFYQKRVTKKIVAKAGDGTSVTFLISAKEVGYADIKITARSAVAADGILKKLLVKAKGNQLFFNRAFLIDLRNKSESDMKIHLDIPNEAVIDSERVEISVIGDLLGSAINNLDHLLRMPYGCGEQNMLNFVPNIAITEYLTKTKQLTEEIKRKAINFMETGYQRELTYQRNDKSFSAFGNDDRTGSVWLTAFVVKSFAQAKNYITIDDRLFHTTLLWLTNHQARNGTFLEVGRVLHKEMQGGSGNGQIALTGFVLSAYLECTHIGLQHLTLSAINRSLNLLEKELSNLTSLYDLAITAYVLQLAGSSKADEAFEKMNQGATIEDGFKYWSQQTPRLSVYNDRANSINVEITSYAMLTFISRGLVLDALPIMRWLVSQQNSNGGFASTQDTVMGIQALAKFAAVFTSPDDFNMSISVSDSTVQRSVTLNKETALVLQRVEFPKTAREIAIHATGNGVGILQLSWSYNVFNATVKPAFRLDAFAETANKTIVVTACVEYIYDQTNESNMAVMELELPSGYIADQEALPSTDHRKKIKRVETKNGETTIVLYFDTIGPQICVTAKGFRSFKVADLKPTLVQVYDYYDPVKRSEKYYLAEESSFCTPTEECYNSS